MERSHARLGAALANGGLDQLVHAAWPDGRHISLRRLLFDLLEEYGGTPATPTCCARPWTAGQVRTHRPAGRPAVVSSRAQA
ncbi:MAG: hypothetical protein ACRDNF_15060 [Streptosporangiaceae bacterium]